VLLEEGFQALKRAVTLIIDEVARTGAFEFDRGEPLNTEGDTCRKVILSGLELGTINK